MADVNELDMPGAADAPRGNHIYVCCLAELAAHAEALRPSHLLSLVLGHEQPPTPACVPGARHLRVEIDDIDAPLPGHILPDESHVGAMIDFLSGWRREGPLLIHCFAGISRSMAAALVALTVDAPGREREAAQRLRQAAPHARPNRRIVALADELLAREGRLKTACEAMGPAAPSLAGPLVCLPIEA